MSCEKGKYREAGGGLFPVLREVTRYSSVRSYDKPVSGKSRGFTRVQLKECPFRLVDILTLKQVAVELGWEGGERWTAGWDI